MGDVCTCVGESTTSAYPGGKPCIDFLYSPPLEEVAATLIGCPEADGATCSTA
jgi:hypothetical protein